MVYEWMQTNTNHNHHYAVVAAITINMMLTFKSLGPPFGEKSTKILSPSTFPISFHGFPSPPSHRGVPSVPDTRASVPSTATRRVQDGCFGSVGCQQCMNVCMYNDNSNTISKQKRVKKDN